jgi:hypothetical protein
LDPDGGGHRAALHAAAERLIAVYGDNEAPEVIHAMLEANYTQVADEATVGSFLPLLAERRTEAQLRGTKGRDG